VTNEFAITGIPTGADSGLQIIGYFKHTDDSVNEVRPGDFILQGKEFDGGWISGDRLEQSRTDLKMAAFPVLHTTSPADNAKPIPPVQGVNYPYIESPITFSWDPVPGAEKYHYTVSEWKGEWEWVQHIHNWVETVETSVPISLPVSMPGHFYNYYVSAFDANGNLLAYDVYSDKNGGVHFSYNFKIQ
jgi:hypothetical protein